MTTVDAELLALDANASAPSLRVARDAMIAALDVSANPSSPHAAGRRARRVLDLARDQVANAMSCSAKDLFFTSGASEGNRWLADAIADYRHRLGRPAHVFTSPLEHPSMAKPLAAFASIQEIELEIAPIAQNGAIDFRRANAADVVVCTLAHNETGIIPDMSPMLSALGDDVIVIVDASQYLGRIAAIPPRVDAAVCSAHKMGGVVGAGAVLWRARARRLRPPWSGGGQEGGLRPGTEAFPAIAAFGAAAAVVERSRKLHAPLAQIRDAVEAKLITESEFVVVPEHSAAGNHAVDRLPNTSALCALDADGEALRMLLDRAGVCVGFGAACSALAPEPSPALLALGLTRMQARATVRLSFAPKDPDDVDKSVDMLAPETLARAVSAIKDAADMARSD